MTIVNHADLAVEWSKLELQRIELAQKQMAIRTELDACQAKLETASKTLRQGVGPNVPQRLFIVGAGQVVMVSSVRGVELVTLEKADG